MELCKEHIGYLGIKIGIEKISLQPHIAKKILKFPDKLEDTKLLQSFLGTLNYARPFIKDFSKIIGPLYSKTTPNGKKYFNQQDIELVRKIKEICKNLPDLALPFESDYVIIETDASEIGWDTVLLAKPNKYSAKSEERICKYASRKYKEKGNIESIDCEILGVINALNTFRLFLNKPFTVRRL